MYSQHAMSALRAHMDKYGPAVNNIKVYKILMLMDLSDTSTRVYDGINLRLKFGLK
jgi:hypothetical protein